MTSNAYDTRRAASTNQPIELYELHLSNGVVINFTSDPESKPVTKGPAYLDNFKTAGDTVGIGMKPTISFQVRQPLLRTQPMGRAAAPYLMEAVHLGLERIDDNGHLTCGGPQNWTDWDIYYSTSSVPGSIKISTTPLIPYQAIMPRQGQAWGPPYNDGGWSDASFVWSGGATPELHVLWTMNSTPWYNGRALVYSHGVPGAMSAPVAALTSSNILCQPFSVQYMDWEGGQYYGYELGYGTSGRTKMLDPDALYWVPEWQGKPILVNGLLTHYDAPVVKYATFFVQGDENSNFPGYRCIAWNSAAGLTDTPDDFTNTAILWYPTNDGWGGRGYMHPYAFRRKGRPEIHVFCTGVPHWHPQAHPGIGGIGYNRYDCTTGNWAYASPKQIIPSENGDAISRPSVFWCPVDERYYMIAYYANAATPTYSALHFYVNDDIMDDDGWEECPNGPPDQIDPTSQFGASNLFCVYSDEAFETHYWTFPVKRESIKRTADDTVNSVTVYFSNVEQHFTSMLSNFDLRMSRIIIKRSFQDLDLSVAGNTATIFEGVIDEYQLTKDYCKVVAKETLLNWDMTFPKRSYSTCCGWRFKGPGCGYGGPENFCNKTFESCTYYGNNAKFGGFCDAAKTQTVHIFKQYAAGATGRTNVYNM